MQQERTHDLPHVSRGDAIKASAWNDIVDAVNGKRPNVSILRPRRSTTASSVSVGYGRIAAVDANDTRIYYLEGSTTPYYCYIIDADFPLAVGQYVVVLGNQIINAQNVW